jgi:hypothetical protein
MNWKNAISKVNPYLVLCAIYSLWLLNLLSRSEGLVDDFDVFFNAGKRILLGENIYGEPHFINLKYFYSPLFASFLSIFQSVDIQIVKVFWFLINTILFFRCLYVIQSWIPKENKFKALAFFVTLLMTGKIILINYTFNQITIVILWTIVEAIFQLKHKRHLLAVLLLCIGINIKILPLVMVPYFIYMSDKPMKTLGLGILILGATVFLPALWLGWDYNQFLIGEWGKTLNPVSKIHAVQTYEYGLLDMGALVSKYLSAEKVQLEPVLNIVSWSDSTVFAIINVLRVLLLSSVVYFATQLKKSIFGIHSHLIVTGAFMALIPLCFPHQREYSYLMFLPIYCFSLNVLFQKKFSWHAVFFIFFSLLSGLLTWRDFAGETIEKVFVFHRLITMGMLGMLYFYMVMMLQTQKANSIKS